MPSHARAIFSVGGRVPFSILAKRAEVVHDPCAASSRSDQPRASRSLFICFPN